LRVVPLHMSTSVHAPVPVAITGTHVDELAVVNAAEVLRVTVAGDETQTKEPIPTLVVPDPSGWGKVILEAARLGAGRLRLALGPGDEATAHTAAACRALVTRGFDVLVETPAPGAAEPVLVPAAAWLKVVLVVHCLHLLMCGGPVANALPTSSDGDAARAVLRGLGQPDVEHSILH